MRMDRQEAGKYGEMLAADYLIQQGYAILARRYRKQGGEADIVAKMGDTYVFCEVKARSSHRYGTGGEAVTPRKQHAIQQACLHYLSEHQLSSYNVRFDVIEVDLKRHSVHHIPNAFLMQ